MQLGTAYVACEPARKSVPRLPGYRLLGRVGVGSSCEVWSAEAPGGFYVALKYVYLPEGLGDEEMQTLQLLRTLRHPNLMATFGAWRAGDFLVIGTELADETLWDRLGDAVDRGLPGIPRDELLEDLAEVAKGIDYLNEPRHRIDECDAISIPHGDLRPQHIMRVGGGIKLADLGTARLADRAVDAPSDRLRAAVYAAPEVFRKQVSRHSDQFALAVTYCQLVSGRLPYPGGAEHVRASQLLGPPDLSMLPERERPVVVRALANEPEDRWPNCRAFLQALRASVKDSPAMPSRANRALDGRAVSSERILDQPEVPVAAHPTAGQRAGRRRERPALIMGSVVLAAAFLAFGIAVALIQLRDPARRTSRSLPFGPTRTASHELTDPITARAAFAKNSPTLAPARDLQISPPPAIVDPKLLVSEVPRHFELPQSPSGEATTPTRSTGAALALDSNWLSGLISPVDSPTAEPSKSRDEPAPIVDPPSIRETAVTPTLTLDVPESLSVEPGRRARLPVKVAGVGLTGPISIHFENLPEGVNATDFSVRLDAAEASADFMATLRAREGEVPLTVVGLSDGIRADRVVRLRILPSRALAHRLEGDSHLARAEYGLAITAYQEAIRLDPEDIKSRLGLGSAFYRKSDYDRAIAALSEVILLRPDDPVAFNNRGLAHRGKGECHKAIDDYSEAIRLKPRDPIARYNRGLAYLYLGDAVMAIASFDEAIRLDPDYASAYRARAQAHELRGDSVRASSDHQEAARRDPQLKASTPVGLTSNPIARTPAGSSTAVSTLLTPIPPNGR